MFVKRTTFEEKGETYTNAYIFRFLTTEVWSIVIRATTCQSVIMQMTEQR